MCRTAKQKHSAAEAAAAPTVAETTVNAAHHPREDITDDVIVQWANDRADDAGALARRIIASTSELSILKADRPYVIGCLHGWDAAVEGGEAHPSATPAGNAALVEALRDADDSLYKLLYPFVGDDGSTRCLRMELAKWVKGYLATPAAVTTQTEDVGAMTPAQMLEVYDRSMTGESISRADETNAHRIAMAAAFGAQAYEDGDGGGQSTHAMIRSVLMALIDPTQEGLDYLRKDPDAAREHRAALAKRTEGQA